MDGPSEKSRNPPREHGAGIRISYPVFSVFPVRSLRSGRAQCALFSGGGNSCVHFTAIPITSKCAPRNNLSVPMNARAGNFPLKYVR
jgi:hypothetical protein